MGLVGGFWKLVWGMGNRNILPSWLQHVLIQSFNMLTWCIPVNCYSCENSIMKLSQRKYIIQIIMFIIYVTLHKQKSKSTLHLHCASVMLCTELKDGAGWEERG